MYPLNLPQYQFKYRRNGDRMEIFDGIRRKFIALNPEEWVRQNFICYLINEKKFPSQLLMIEKEHRINNRKKRCDIIVCDYSGKPFILIECKAYNMKISNSVFEQASAYNLTHQVSNIILTNGLEHYFMMIDPATGMFKFSDKIPDFTELLAVK